MQKSSKRRKNKSRKYCLEQYRHFSKEEKNKKHLYACERYRNLPEDEKQSLAEYRKNYK